MQITIAKEIGYCFGVRNAVETAIIEARRTHHESGIFSLGPLIHNKHTVQMLSVQYNIHPVDKINQIPRGSTVIIRTHGTTPTDMEELKIKGFRVIDATCPFVLQTQGIAKELVREGYFLIILGKKAHPEVIGIAGHAGTRYQVVQERADLDGLILPPKVGVVFQSTAMFEDFNWVPGILASRVTQLRLHKTICGVTIARQKSVADVAQRVQLMLIIGDKNSSNTKKLAQISKKYTDKTYHIEEPHELGLIRLDDIQSLGIGTGTSTPDSLVEDVLGYLRSSICKQLKVSRGV
jgi:4-hydroxy-3-methylbut-2-enyl diphosphate reductase